jgi:protein ImuB
MVLPEPIQVDVLDAGSRPVAVSGRVAVSAAPAFLVWEGRRLAIADWAGPWPVDECWLDPERARRLVRCQVVLTDGRALLLTLSCGVWRIEGFYD